MRYKPDFWAPAGRGRNGCDAVCGWFRHRQALAESRAGFKCGVAPTREAENVVALAGSAEDWLLEERSDALRRETDSRSDLARAERPRRGSGDTGDASECGRFALRNERSAFEQILGVEGSADEGAEFPPVIVAGDLTRCS